MIDTPLTLIMKFLSIYSESVSDPVISIQPRLYIPLCYNSYNLTDTTAGTGSMMWNEGTRVLSLEFCIDFRGIHENSKNIKILLFLQKDIYSVSGIDTSNIPLPTGTGELNGFRMEMSDFEDEFFAHLIKPGIKIFSLYSSTPIATTAELIKYIDKFRTLLHIHKGDDIKNITFKFKVLIIRENLWGVKMTLKQLETENFMLSFSSNGCHMKLNIVKIV